MLRRPLTPTSGPTTGGSHRGCVPGRCPFRPDTTLWPISQKRIKPATLVLGLAWMEQQLEPGQQGWGPRCGCSGQAGRGAGGTGQDPRILCSGQRGSGDAGCGAICGPWQQGLELGWALRYPCALWGSFRKEFWGSGLPVPWGSSPDPHAPLPQEFILSCLARDPAHRPSAHNLLFHRVLFEVHSLKLLAAHCFIQHQCKGWLPGGPRGSALPHPALTSLWPADLMPENVVEEKTKAMDLHAVLAELPRPPRPPLQWR